MREHMSPIPSRLYNAAVDGHVTGADQIIDDRTGLTLDKFTGGALEEKEYTSGSNNGMGRVVLRKNLVEGVNTLIQNMINKSNTIYVIQYDFTLGEDITVPESCVLEFNGGKIIGNFHVYLNYTNIINPYAGMAPVFVGSGYTNNEKINLLLGKPLGITVGSTILINTIKFQPNPLTFVENVCGKLGISDFVFQIGCWFAHSTSGFPVISDMTVNYIENNSEITVSINTFLDLLRKYNIDINCLKLINDLARKDLFTNFTSDEQTTYINGVTNLVNDFNTLLISKGFNKLQTVIVSNEAFPNFMDDSVVNIINGVKDNLALNGIDATVSMFTSGLGISAGWKSLDLINDLKIIGYNLYNVEQLYMNKNEFINFLKIFRDSIDSKPELFLSECGNDIYIDGESAKSLQNRHAAALRNIVPIAKELNMKQLYIWELWNDNVLGNDYINWFIKIFK